MLNFVPKIMVICLLITIVIEFIGAYLLRIKDKCDLVIVVLVNILTNPILVVTTNLLYVYFGKSYYYVSLIILELLVLYIEGYIYKKLLINKNINPYLLSLILNMNSYFLGNIINYFI